jgi:3-phenylpropionate/trans-cinnamate dioxygenase ferredoxin reductase subunit
MIETQLRRKGVRLRFGTTITTVEEAADGSCLIGFDDGGPQEIADYLVVCVGVRPNVSFLDRQQVRMDRGILVDETMRTNCEDLYAAGDVTQGGDLLSGEQRIIGLWANARLQGRTAGLNMAGCWTRYPGTVPHNITHFMDIDLVSAGDVLKGDTVYEDMDADRYTYCRFVWTAGRLTGFNLLNMPQVSGILKNHLIKGLVTEKNLLSYLTQDTLIMNKLYQKFPGLEKVFTSMEAH